MTGHFVLTPRAQADLDEIWRLIHCNVTAHPSAAWTLQQRREAVGFCWRASPRYNSNSTTAEAGRAQQIRTRPLPGSYIGCGL
jgi:hypothetical protein